MDSDVIAQLGEALRRVKAAREELDIAGETTQTRNAAVVASALYNLSEPLGRSYQQVLGDVADTGRISWAGTAHEIRQILSSLLQALAPDDDVRKNPGYKQEPNTSGPTQKQRVHYILSKRGGGSKETDVLQIAGQLDSAIAELVRASYSRASDAAHRFKDRKEVVRILKYFDAFAYDLLDL